MGRVCRRRPMAATRVDRRPRCKLSWPRTATEVSHDHEAHRRQGVAARHRHALPASLGRTVPLAPANAHRQRRGTDPVRRQLRPPATGILVEPTALAHRNRRARLRAERRTGAGDGYRRKRSCGRGRRRFPRPTIATGHHLQNRSSEDATFLEVGTRAASDSATYSDVDLFSPPHQQPALYTHRNGTPYPKRDRTGPATT
jgi:hypothetical protein